MHTDNLGATYAARAKFELQIDHTSKERAVIRKLDDKLPLTVRCGLCDWTLTKPQRQALKAQAQHRTKHSV